MTAHQARLTVGEERRLRTVERRAASVDPAERHAALEEAQRLHEEVWARLPPSQTTEGRGRLGDLARLADLALAELGAAPPASWSLREYDASRYGPLFGVSDDGDAAATIVQAFLDSPKSRVLRRLHRLTLKTIGGVVDAERMSAAGELLVGLEEYMKVRQATAGRVPMTTNVGTVVLPRFYRAPPTITYLGNSERAIASALTALAAEFQPYLAQPAGGRPLAATVYVAFRGEDRLRRQVKLSILRELNDAVTSGRFCDPQIHELGLLQRSADRGSSAPKFAIDLAADAGLKEVLIEGHARYESQDQLFFSGLLLFFPPARVNEILEHARTRDVSVTVKNRIDPETAARTIWAGLTAARSVGAHLGKFGLFPLTLDEQTYVIGRVKQWFPSWTPTPAFYVDRPVISTDHVFQERALVEPARRWLSAAADAGADVVLIDAPDRTPAPAGAGRRRYGEDRGRRLLKQDDGDEVGVLTMEDVDTLERHAARLPAAVRILWAGGLNAEQAFKLAARGAFGIFTTSTTASRVALGPGQHDPTLAAELEPTYLGVLSMRTVIEAGFLSRAARDAATRVRIRKASPPVIEAIGQGLLTSVRQVDEIPALRALRDVVERAWEAHLDRDVSA
jgi:hypothetical protein